MKQKRGPSRRWEREIEGSAWLCFTEHHVSPFLRCVPFTPRGHSECCDPPGQGETQPLSTWNLPGSCETVIVL